MLRPNVSRQRARASREIIRSLPSRSAARACWASPCALLLMLFSSSVLSLFQTSFFHLVIAPLPLAETVPPLVRLLACFGAFGALRGLLSRPNRRETRLESLAALKASKLHEVWRIDKVFVVLVCHGYLLAGDAQRPASPGRAMYIIGG